MNEFGEFLYKLRKEKAMTQAELAELLGVTNKAVSKWETGDAMPETAQLLPLSRIFDVSIDELLKGKRDIQSEETASIEDNLFTRGKDDNEEKTLLEKIKGTICTIIIFSGLLAFFVLGILYDLWHPYWVLIPTCALSCGVIGVIFDVCNEKKRKATKAASGKDPLAGAICGIIILVSIITYLLLGALLNLWHPLWIILFASAFVCGVIKMLVEIITHKNK